jgi:hypothetical protein
MKMTFLDAANVTNPRLGEMTFVEWEWLLLAAEVVEG